MRYGGTFDMVKKMFLVVCFSMFLLANDKEGYREAMIHELHQITALSIITKDYVMVAMNNTFNNPEKDMQKEIARFNNEQTQLLALPLEKALHDSIVKQQEKWEEISAFLQGATTQENFLKLRKLIYPLRSNMRKQIAMFRKKLNSKQTDTIYYAGKLSAISQEFAGIYLLLKWGTNSNMDKLKVDILIQSSMYVDTLSRLNKIVASDSKEEQILKKLDLYFRYLSYINKSAKTFTPVLVYRKSNMMSKYSNKIIEIASK